MRKLRAMFAKPGSKENPIRLGLYEMEDLRKILAEGDSEYDRLIHAENPDRAAEVREQYRARILKRWPMLYDHCHIEYGWDPNRDYHRDQTARWFRDQWKMPNVEVLGEKYGYT